MATSRQVARNKVFSSVSANDPTDAGHVSMLQAVIHGENTMTT